MTRRVPSTLRMAMSFPFRRPLRVAVRVLSAIRGQSQEPIDAIKIDTNLISVGYCQ
jgi:hypothetical protein